MYEESQIGSLYHTSRCVRVCVHIVFKTVINNNYLMIIKTGMECAELFIVKGKNMGGIYCCFHA